MFDISTLATAATTPSAAPPPAVNPPAPAEQGAPSSQRVTPGTPEWAALTLSSDTPHSAGRKILAPVATRPRVISAKPPSQTLQSIVLPRMIHRRRLTALRN